MYIIHNKYNISSQCSDDTIKMLKVITLIDWITQRQRFVH